MARIPVIYALCTPIFSHSRTKVLKCTPKFFGAQYKLSSLGTRYAVFNLGCSVGNKQQIYYFNLLFSTFSTHIFFAVLLRPSPQHAHARYKLSSLRAQKQYLYQTANYVVRAEDLPAVPGRTIVYCLKTMARRASPVHTLQSYQSGIYIVVYFQHTKNFPPLYYNYLLMFKIKFL